MINGINEVMVNRIPNINKNNYLKNNILFLNKINIQKINRNDG